MIDKFRLDSVLALRRTIAPLVWAWVVGVLAEWGFDVTAALGDRPMTIGALMLLLAVVIYVAAILLGKRWPWIERAILTSADEPHYEPKHAAPDKAPTP